MHNFKLPSGRQTFSESTTSTLKSQIIKGLAVNPYMAKHSKRITSQPQHLYRRHSLHHAEEQSET